MAVGDHPLAQALAHHHGQFAQALQGLSRQIERDYFAHVLLCRLLLIYDLQVAGFLAQGDRWYLHNQLGQPAPGAAGSFFSTFLQPLCHQGFSLPTAERPQKLQPAIGDVPYLSSPLLAALPLEQRSPHLDLPDEPLEQFLGWLAEHPWQRDEGTAQGAEEEVAVISRSALAAAWECLLAAVPGKATATSAAHLEAIGQQTIEAHMGRAIADYTASSAPPTLAALSSVMSDDLCVHLIARVLPSLSILDPACGSGRLLLMALARLQGIYQACWAHAQQSAQPQLQAWVRSLQALAGSPQWAWTQQIMTQNLYGVDVRPAAIAVTQTQLWLRLLSTVKPGDGLPLLPNLDFNMVAGNALIGFIRVDEESFDQIVPKRSKTAEEPETVLQGNLLQLLAAASYRDTLAEKQIRVEHYRAQTQAMGLEGGIPEYVQREFLRDRIEAVNAAAQQKLNGLLFETLSRQLGIFVKEPQASGRPRRRLLTPADIEALQPCHWGFVFNHIIAQGGFDLIITQPPEGTLRPRTDEFYRLHAELFEQLAIPLSAFRRSRRQILQQHPELANHWGIYAGRIACLRDYVRRSKDFAQLQAATLQRSISFRQLLAARCAALVKAGSIAPYLE